MSLKQSQVRGRARRGLTLMELVVVMVVLAALAAILIPLFPNMIRRSHKVGEATQAAEVAKAVQLYEASYLGFANDWDLMTTGTGATAPDFLPNEGGTPFGGAATITTLTQPEVDALNKVGITTGHTFATTITPGATFGNHPTENPYAAAVTTPTTLSTSTNVFVIGSANVSGPIPVEIQNILARDTTGTTRFVVFGVGPRSTMVGKVMQSAPVAITTGAAMTPSNFYSRTGVIFQIAGPGINKTERARFIGAVALEDDGIEGGEAGLIGYYDVATSGE